MFNQYLILANLAALAGYVGTGLTLVNIYYLRNMPDLPHQERSAVMKESILTLALAASGFSTRAAFDLGYECYVVADACASRDLVYADRVISADTVHCAFLAALQGLYGKVMTGQEFITIFSADS